VTDLQQVLGQLCEVLAADLGDTAHVSLSPASSRFRTCVVRIDPRSADAAPVALWAEDDALAASAGDRAQFLFDDEGPEDLIRKVRSVVEAVSRGRLVDRYLGTRYLSSALEEPKPPRFARLVRWPAYRA
jgi:hypothetical protein